MRRAVLHAKVELLPNEYSSSRTPTLLAVAADSVEQTLEGGARRVALKNPMRAIKLAPGCS
jgi:hypothetical protein